MSKSISVLILEDVPADAELTKFELMQAGIDFTAHHATDRKSYLRALEKPVFDIILSDYSLPAFDGSSALRIAQEKCPLIPFILVSGELSEETAAELIRQGATDYVLKNSLSRLGPSVLRVLREVEKHNELRIAHETLKQNEQALALKSRNLEEANTTLKVLLKQRTDDKAAMEEQVLANVRRLILPQIKNLKDSNLCSSQLAQVRAIEEKLEEIVSPFLRHLTSSFADLTPREIQVANLVKEGKTTREMTDILAISATAVDFHRKNLRSKFGLKNKRTNLRAYLSSLN